MAKARIGVLISGTGSNMAALIYASRRPECPFDIVLVGSNSPDAPGVRLAEGEGVPTFVRPNKGLSRADHDAAMHAALCDAECDYVALAGYMRILTPGFVDQWQGRMLNIHPSLLPRYKGLDTHRRALEAGDTHAGCSVHIVTAELDDGPILGQTEVAILPGDTPDTLAARVLIAEHQLYSRVLAAYVGRERDPAWLTDRVRALAMAETDAEESISHGMACFGIVKGKKFAWVSRNHHGDGKTALLVKISGAEEQAMLIERDAERFYRPAYFGDDWIGVRLDLPGTDWDDIAARISASWRAVAPKKLTRLIDAAEMF